MTQLIPKIIYQTWHTKNVPEGMANVMSILKRLNPDYEYHLYDDSDCESYIEREYPQFLGLYKSIIPGAYRADLWRLLILYQRGGVYIDAKQHHYRPLHTIIDPDVSMFVCKDRPEHCIFNAILGAVPRHPYIGYCILMAIYNISTCCMGKDYLDITGPRMIGELLASIVHIDGDWTRKRYDSLDIPIELVGIDNIVDRKGQLFGRTTYPTYYNIDRKQDYGIMYHIGKVFRHVPMKYIVDNRPSVTGIYPSGLDINVEPSILDTILVPIPIVRDDTIVLDCINKELSVHDVTVYYTIEGERKMSTMSQFSIPISQCRMVDTSLPQKIPRIIHQTDEYRLQPSYIYNTIEATKRLNPDYEYRFYDDIDRREMIGNHFPSDVQKAYDSLIPGAYRADLWRYCVLYLYGGVYIDHKMTSLAPLRDIIEADNTLIVCLEPVGSIGLFNAVIACTPKHPLMKKAIDVCVSNIVNRYKDDFLGITGPKCLYQAYISLYGSDINEGRKDGVVVLRHESMTYVRDVNGKKLLNKRNRAYYNRRHSYATMYMNGCIFNTHINPLIGSVPILGKYRVCIQADQRYPDVFDCRLIPYNGERLLLMVQRRDAIGGWGQELNAVIYTGSNDMKSIYIGKSDFNLRIIDIPIN